MKTLIKNTIVKFFFWVSSMIPIHIEAQTTRFNPVENKRDKIAASFEKGKTELIIEKLPKYNEQVKDSNGNYILMVWEQELVDLINGDYEKLLENIIKNEDEFYEERNNRTFLRGYRFDDTPHYHAERLMGDEFNRALLRYLELNRTKHELKISYSELSDEEKAFLVFYLRLSIFYDGQCQDRTQELMGDAARDFIRKHPNSTYAEIVKKYGSFKAYQSDWTTGYSAKIFGAGVVLNESKDNHLGTITNILNFGVSASYKNIFAQASGGFAGMKIKNSKNIYKDYDLTTSMGFSGEIIFGYNFHTKNKRFTISPFLGLKWIDLDANIMELGYDSEIHEHSDFLVEKIQLKNRAPIIGVNVDFNTECNFRCNGSQLVSRTYNRLQVGVTSTSIPIADKLSETTQLMISWVIGIESERERRVPNF